MLIEKNTEYYDYLKKLDCEYFTNLQLLCSDLMKKLPPLSDVFYLDAIKHGGANLNSESQMTSYLGYFGKFYEFLHSYPFDILPYEFFENKKINIVDYDCGMAIWAMLYKHFSILSDYTQWVNNVTLIEPSELLLKRAALHTSVFCPEASIRTVNKKLDDLTQDDIDCDDNIPTLHIMADVLERKDFDMDRLVSMIKSSFKGINRFLCVQLYFGNYKEDNRVRKFTSYFTDSASFGSVPQRDMELVYVDYPVLMGTTCVYATFGGFDDNTELEEGFSSNIKSMMN